jgi:hypothetical protein
LIVGAPRNSGRGRGLLVAVAAGLCAGIGSSLVVGKWYVDRQAKRSAAEIRRLVEARLADERPQFVPVPYPQSPPASGQLPPESGQEQRERTPSRSGLGPQDFAKRAEQRAQQEEKDERLLRDHWTETVDKPWADRSAQSLRADLEALAKKNRFRLADVDCRNTSCLATLEWKTMEEASPELRAIAGHLYKVNCSRMLKPPEKADPSQAVKIPLYFDCTQWKAEGSRPLSASGGR